MNLKPITLFLLLVICNILILTPQVVPVNSFQYYEDSFFPEVTQADFNLSLSEGNHTLVLDNTGFASGRHYLNRKAAYFNYSIVLPDINMTLSNKSFPLPLTSQSVFHSTFTINHTSTLVSIRMCASANVTVFMTNEKGLEDFLNEWLNASMPPRQPPSVFQVSILIMAISFIIVIMLFIWYRHRKLTESIYSYDSLDTVMIHLNIK